LEGKDSERDKIKEKRRKIAFHNQQAWRRYNHVKFQRWTPYGMPIHVFLMFKPLLMLFEIILYFLV
jgi:hypothetical protein